MLSARVISKIERNNPEGLTSKQIFEVLDEHGESLSEATFRKYVQLGLLPRSRRVGQKGKHRGSLGIYPVEVIRRVDEIRRAMSNGQTLEDLAVHAQATLARITNLKVAMEDVVGAAEADLAGRTLERAKRSALKAELTSLKKQGKSLQKALEQWSSQLQNAAAESERAGAAKGTGKNKRSKTRRS